MAPTREKIIKHQTPLALPPMRHLCISEVLISWQQQNYNSTIHLRLNKTHIHPTILSIKLHPSSVLWGIQTIKRSWPATTNWEDLSVTPPYDFPRKNATPSVSCRPSWAFLPCRIFAAYWVDLHWIAGCDQNLARFLGVGVLLTCQNSTLTKDLEKWCLSQFLLNSTEDISVWRIKVSGSEVRVEIQVWCWSNTIGWPRTWSGSFKLQWRHQSAWYTPSCSWAAFGLQETTVPTKGLGKRNHEGGYECIFATKNKVDPKVGIFAIICACIKTRVCVYICNKLINMLHQTIWLYMLHEWLWCSNLVAQGIYAKIHPTSQECVKLYKTNFDKTEGSGLFPRAFKVLPFHSPESKTCNTGMCMYTYVFLISGYILVHHKYIHTSKQTSIYFLTQSLNLNCIYIYNH